MAEQAKEMTKLRDGSLKDDREPASSASASGCAGGPLEWMIRKSLAIQKALQVFFGWVASGVVAHPNRCIWAT